MNQSDYIPLLFGTPTFHWNDHRLMALRDDITCRDVIPSSIGSAAPGPEHMTPCKVSGGGGGHCRVRNRLEDVGDEVTSEHLEADTAQFGPTSDMVHFGRGSAQFGAFKLVVNTQIRAERYGQKG
jgi:hypothetical protein